jgi:hypothetical protein
MVVDESVAKRGYLYTVLDTTSTCSRLVILFCIMLLSDAETTANIHYLQSQNGFADVNGINALHFKML